MQTFDQSCRAIPGRVITLEDALRRATNPNGSAEDPGKSSTSDVAQEAMTPSSRCEDFTPSKRSPVRRLQPGPSGAIARAEHGPKELVRHLRRGRARPRASPPGIRPRSREELSRGAADRVTKGSAAWRSAGWEDEGLPTSSTRRDPRCGYAGTIWRGAGSRLRARASRARPSHALFRSGSPRRKKPRSSTRGRGLETERRVFSVALRGARDRLARAPGFPGGASF